MLSHRYEAFMQTSFAWFCKSSERKLLSLVNSFRIFLSHVVPTTTRTSSAFLLSALAPILSVNADRTAVLPDLRGHAYCQEGSDGK